MVLAIIRSKDSPTIGVYVKLDFNPSQFIRVVALLLGAANRPKAITEAAKMGRSACVKV
jgi:hypothetical protein